MAQQTSNLWKALWRERGTTREYQFDVSGTIYGPEAEISHKVDHGLYDTFGIGNAAMATLTISLFAESIHKGACIKRYIRLRNRERVSEWLPKGVFYANRRSEEDGYWTVEAYDDMRKAERPWEPRQDLIFPMAMPDAVAEFMRIRGMKLDPRTQLNPAYKIGYPSSDPDSETGEYYSIRQHLQWIAAAHGGNFIMSDEGKLWLVPLISAPPETSYLVTEHGDAITLGGVRLLV